MNKQNKKLETITVITSALAAILCSACLSGCSSSAGWRVSFGVSPVTAIDDHASLTAQAHATKNHSDNY